MKTQQEIKDLAEQYIKDNTGDHYVYCGFVDGYTQCQEDMADVILDEDDIKEMALDYIINTGGLPKTIKEWQNALWKFYQLTKQTRLI